ncbi:phospholipase D-like domain-containing protein [Xylophilus sp. ASV27]|uniref:phospholipase D-like domain-containing protein n=1 Tax=Xylophilus sp. ASV27 TaxID=2795129 RepID=UPI0018EAFA10|nr:phospholipase D-like domain-containing protein [Xylophilus sp. ASV27]
MLRPLLDWLPTIPEHLLFGSLAVLAYVVTTRARREQRAPSSAIAWVMGLALMPYVVLPMYLMFGSRKLRPAGLPRARVAIPSGHWAAELIGSFGLAPPSACSVRLHQDGSAALAALRDTIAQARSRLDVCTFLIGDDEIGRDTVERLAARAREGLRVRLLLDGFGALVAPRRYFDALRAAGAEVAVFRPFFSLRSVGPRNLRNHRKLLIADNAWLWCGGRNLAAEYFTGRPGEAAWTDLSFDLHGGVAAAAAHQFEQDWAAARRQAPRPAARPPEAPHGALAQFLPSGPDQLEDTAQALLIDACFRARQRILIVTPYFVPDNGLRDAMRLAARRGVRITVALPTQSNHRLADFVRTRSMRDLAQTGVRFSLLPAMAHAKAVVVDDTLALCGSINLDLRSLLLNHEAAVVFYSQAEIEWLARWITALAATGADFDPQPPGLMRDISEGLLLTIAFQL